MLVLNDWSLWPTIEREDETEEGRERERRRENDEVWVIELIFKMREVE